MSGKTRSTASTRRRRSSGGAPRWLRAVAFGVALLLAGAAPSTVAAPACERNGATSLPPPFRLLYNVRVERGMLGFTGDNELRFEIDGGRYALTSQTQATVLYEARQSSRGAVAAGGLQPIVYAESRTRRAEQTVRFDRDAGEVIFSANDTREPIARQVQDRLSLLVEVSRRIAAAKPGNSIDVPVAGVRRIENYSLRNGGRESIDVPAGRFDVIKLERDPQKIARANGAGAPRGAREDRLQMWIAPSLCGLPVRVRYEDEHGLVVDNTLKAANFGR